MMANNTYKFFIITGDPGVGKTTLTKKVSSSISAKGVKLSGFYTEEVRKGGVREGFDVVSMEGVRARLARDLSLLNGPVKYKVGKYGVLIEEFEKVALPTLVQPPNLQSLLVIDEIGKMEFFSDSFKTSIRQILHPNSNYIVLATIPSRRSDQLIESIRSNSQAKIWMVTRENRNRIHEEISSEIYTALNLPNK